METKVLIVLAIILVLVTVTIIILSRRSYPRKKLPEITITLAELSQIWMPYNKNIEPVPVSDESIDELFEDIVDETDATAFAAKKQIPETYSEDSTYVDTQKTENLEEKVENDKTNEDKAQVVRLPESVGPLKEFWAKCIQPYKKEIQEQGAAPVIQELINLIEKHGQVSSIVIDNRDTESTELISVRDNLSQVTLKEHTYHVCMKMIDLVKDTYKDYQNLIPKALVSCLAHDIGKIPAFRETGVYNTYDHSLVGANKLAEIFSGNDVFWAKQAIQSVKEHHMASRDQWTTLLKQADREARQAELLRFTAQYEIKPFDAWFSVDKFLKELEGYINITQTNKWEAFSFQGIVYCKPDLLYNIAKKMCRQAKVLDLSFAYESDKEIVFRHIVNALRKESLIVDTLGQGHYARRFEIKTKIGMAKSVRYMLTPIKAERFNITELESRKQGFLEVISAVIAI